MKTNLFFICSSIQAQQLSTTQQTSSAKHYNLLIRQNYGNLFLHQNYVYLTGGNDASLFITNLNRPTQFKQKMFKKINFTHYLEITDQREATLLLFNLKKCTCDELTVAYHSKSEPNKLQMDQSIEKNLKLPCY